MKTVYIGSAAIHFWCKEFRKPKDIDIWSYLDLDFRYVGEDRIDFKKIPKEIFNLIPNYYGYATLNAVYTIKCSHLGWDNPMWLKHKRDILWLKSEGCEIIPALYDALVAYWKQELGNKEFLSLSQDKEGFFDDHVNYVYDHDYLHEVISYPNKPVYTKCLKDGQDVLTDKDKFDKLSFDDKVLMFTEEITAISCERWLCNPYWMERNMNINKSHNLSVKKTITNLTKNWATDFIVKNLTQFIKPNYDLYNKVIRKLNLQEKIMSDVDKKELEQFMKACMQVGWQGSLYSCVDDFDTFIFECCADNLYKDYIPEEGFDYKWLDAEGGGEGGAEDCFGVFSLNGIVYKASWSYYSYDGDDFEHIEHTLKIVTPKEKTITVYE